MAVTWYPKLLTQLEMWEIGKYKDARVARPHACPSSPAPRPSMHQPQSLRACPAPPAASSPRVGSSTQLRLHKGCTCDGDQHQPEYSTDSTTCIKPIGSNDNVIDLRTDSHSPLSSTQTDTKLAAAQILKKPANHLHSPSLPQPLPPGKSKTAVESQGPATLVHDQAHCHLLLPQPSQPLLLLMPLMVL